MMGLGGGDLRRFVDILLELYMRYVISMVDSRGGYIDSHSHRVWILMNTNI